jgi:Spy/CpxP family protein refolding chaperone
MVRLAACVIALLPVVTIAGTLELGAASTAPAVLDRQDRGQPPHGAPADGRPRDRWKWWLYDRAELSLTDKQSAEIDKIFESTIPAQRAKREELERLEEALAVTVNEHKADVSAVAQQVERVENLRAEFNKTRTVMLYRIDLLLSPEQRAKLERLRARREDERRKDPNHRR